MISSGPTFRPRDANTRLAPVMAIIPNLIFSSRVMSQEVGEVAFLSNKPTHDWRFMMLGKIRKSIIRANSALEARTSAFLHANSQI